MYRVLLFVHVFAVILWVGPGFLFQILTERAAATEDTAALSTVVREGERLGKTLFGPASIIVLASGIWLTLEGNWGFDQIFVIGGLVGVVASIAIGGLFIGPTVGSLAEGLGSSSTLDPALKRGLLRLRNAGRVDALIMTVVVFLMTVKPGP
ncbi:MAG TPA: DUF2269 family protein [Actinomycetota bacterium]|nr:DUF2269 family protein [Actinomycetota bacterium]